jgi:hypothetical protein
MEMVMVLFNAPTDIENRAAALHRRHIDREAEIKRLIAQSVVDNPGATQSAGSWLDRTLSRLVRQTQASSEFFKTRYGYELRNWTELAQG